MQFFIAVVVILFLVLFVLMSMPLDADESLDEHTDTQPNRSATAE